MKKVFLTSLMLTLLFTSVNLAQAKTGVLVRQLDQYINYDYGFSVNLPTNIDDTCWQKEACQNNPKSVKISSSKKGEFKLTYGGNNLAATIQVVKVKSQSAVKAEFIKHFGKFKSLKTGKMIDRFGKTCTISYIKDRHAINIYDVEIKGNKSLEDESCAISYPPIMKYNKETNNLYYYNSEAKQAVVLIDVNGDARDGEMARSFEVLDN